MAEINYPESNDGRTWARKLEDVRTAKMTSPDFDPDVAVRLLTDQLQEAHEITRRAQRRARFLQDELTKEVEENKRLWEHYKRLWEHRNALASRCSDLEAFAARLKDALEHVQEENRRLRAAISPDDMPNPQQITT